MATKNFRQDLKAANALYRRHRKLSKVAYEHNLQQIRVLKLHVAVPQSIEKWLLQANAFYKVLASDHPVIQQYGVLAEELAQAQAMAGALLDTRNGQVAAKGKARHATRQRNKALAALNAWMKEFRMAARYALREDTKLLKVLSQPDAAPEL